MPTPSAEEEATYGLVSGSDDAELEIDDSVEKDIKGTSTDIQFDAAKAINQVNQSAAMASFVAGFCYYEAGRFDFYGYPGTRSANYINATVGAFVLAVLSVSLSSFITRYGTALRLSKAQAAFAISANEYVRYTHRSYTICFLCLAVAMMFLGDTYYPTTCGSMRSSCNLAVNDSTRDECTTELLDAAECYPTTAKFIPLVGGIFTFLGILYSHFRVLRAFGANAGVVLADDASKITQEQVAGMQLGLNARGDSKQEIKQVDDKVRIINTIKGQATFVAGFSFAGMTRLLPIDLTDTSRDNTVSQFYLIFMTMTTCFSLVCSIGMTTVNIFVLDFPPNKRFSFVTHLDSTIKLFTGLFYTAVISFFVAFTILPWGVDFSLEHGNRNLAYIVIVGGIVSLVSIIGACWYTHCQAMAVLAEHTLSAPSDVDPDLNGQSAASGASSERVKEAWTAVSAKVEGVGGQITVCCGFVAYNLFTFKTDVLNFIEDTKCSSSGKCGFVTMDFCSNPSNVGELCNHSLRQYEFGFLLLVTATFCIGLINVFMCNFISLTGNLAFSNRLQKDAFAHRMVGMSQFAVRCYRLDLFLFLMVHGAYGFVKMNPMVHSPMIASGIALVLMMICYFFFDNAYSQARAKDIELLKTPSVVPVPTPEYSKLKEMLGTWPGRSLFFGCFAYFAVMFFYLPDKNAAEFYCLCMGLCFGFSVVVTTLSTFIKIRIDKLATQGAKETLAVGVKGMMRFMYFLYQGTIILFFLGFIQIGYIKPGFSLPWDPRFTVPIVAIGLTGLAVSVLFNICEAMDLGPGKKVCARSMYEKENASLNTTNDSTYDGWKARSTQRNLSYAVQVLHI
jgi:hypothetical protein